MSKHFSIRDRLERDAWRNHRRFAQLRASHRPSRPGAGLPWQDRALLILAALLVLLLIVRVETARAATDDDSFWGLVDTAPGGARSVALDTAIQVEVTGLASLEGAGQGDLPGL